MSDDIAPPAVPGGRGYFPVGDPKYAALTEGKQICIIMGEESTDFDFRVFNRARRV